MKNIDRVALALEIVPYLNQHNGISRREVAQHFGISPTELQQILTTVVMCGVPGYFGGDLVDIDIWEDNLFVYHGQGLEKPLRLRPSESAALVLALRNLEHVPGLGHSDAIASALAKIENLATTEKKSSVADVTDSVASDGVIDSVNSRMEIVENAITQQCVLAVDYVSGTGAASQSRRILPLALTVQQHHGYVVTWDIGSAELRLFRLDRLHSVREDTEMTPTISISAAEVRRYLDACEAPYLARISFPETAVWLVDELALQNVKRSNDGALEADLPYYSEAWLQRTALSYGDLLTIILPSDVQESLRRCAANTLARYT